MQLLLTNNNFINLKYLNLMNNNLCNAWWECSISSSNDDYKNLSLDSDNDFFNRNNQSSVTDSDQEEITSYHIVCAISSLAPINPKQNDMVVEIDTNGVLIRKKTRMLWTKQMVLFLYS
jgi:hypothetical protein